MAHGGEEDWQDEVEPCCECGQLGGNICDWPECQLSLCDACAERHGGYCGEHGPNRARQGDDELPF